MLIGQYGNYNGSYDGNYNGSYTGYDNNSTFYNGTIFGKRSADAEYEADLKAYDYDYNTEAPGYGGYYGGYGGYGGKRSADTEPEADAEAYDYDYNSEAPGYGGYYNGNYNGSYTGYAKNINIFLNFVNVESTDIGDIKQRIIAALRIMIEREIGLFRLNNIPKPTAAPVPSGSLSNIIGTGENFVKLESPDINYFFYF